MNDNNNSANKFLFLAGLITGAAAAVYLNTPHGKKVRNAIVDKADEYSTTVKDKATEVATTAKEKARSAYDTASNKAKSALDTASNKAKSVLDSASSTITDVKDRFINKTEDIADSVEVVAENKASDLQKGINKAKGKINTAV